MSDLYADWHRWLVRRSGTSNERAAVGQAWLDIPRRQFSNWIQQIMPEAVKYTSNGRSCLRGIVILPDPLEPRAKRAPLTATERRQ